MRAVCNFNWKQCCFLVVAMLCLNMAFAQTNPTPHDLKSGDYVFTNFFANGSATYPPSMQGWSGDVATLQPTASTTAQATGDEPLCFGCPDQGSTINNSDINGISLCNSSDVGAFALALALNTTDCFGVKVAWLSVFDAENNDLSSTGLQLQWRVGTTGDWNNLVGQDKIWSVATFPTDHTDFLATLPADCDNQPVVQLRWVLHIVNNILPGNRLYVSKIHVMPERITGVTGYSRAGGNCDSTGANPWFSIYRPAAISSVSTLSGAVSPFNAINNYFGLVNGYSDYTGPNDSILKVQTGDVFDMDVVINAGAIGTGYTNDLKTAAIYIDWNQDEDFVDEDEYFPVSTTGALLDYIGTITVPATAKSGYTRMRVRLVRSDITMTPTGPAPDGETEDYRVLVDNLLFPLVDCVAPASYVPTDGKTICLSTDSLRWGAVTGADGYRLTLINTTTSTTVVDKDTALVPSYSLTGLLMPATDYSWIASAYDANGNAINCDTLNFKTPANPDPVADIIPVSPATVCQNELLGLDGNPSLGTLPYMHTWTGSDNTTLSDPTVVAPTYTAKESVGTHKYYYTVTDANGCKAIDSIEIETLAPANAGTVTAEASPICSGNSTKLVVTGSVGTISWESAVSATGPWSGTTLTLVTGTTYSTGMLSSTTYFRAVALNGNCSITGDPIEILVTQSPIKPIVSPTSAALCSGKNVTLTVTNYLGDITWNDAATTANVQLVVSTAGSYVASSTALGCTTSSDPVVVTVNPVPATPTIQTVGANPSCDGQTVQLVSSSAGNNFWSTGETTQSIIVSSTADYALTVKNTFGCETDSVRKTVTFNPSPPKPIISANPSGDICAGDSVVLTSSNVGSNKWSTNATTDFITVKNAGNYLVTTEGTNGCKSVSDAYIVVVKPLPAKPIISASGPLCQGTPVQLTSSVTGTNTWSTGSNQDFISITTDGDYTVTNTGVNGCGNKSAVFKALFNPLPVTPTITQTGNVMKSSVTGASYQWYNVNGPITGATSITYTPSVSGLYYVVVKSAAGCESNQSAGYQYSGVGISKQDAVLQLLVFPNPSYGTFEVVLPSGTQSGNWSILDLSGRAVVIGEFSGDKLIITQNISKGLYILKLTANSNDYIQRIQVN